MASKDEFQIDVNVTFILDAIESARSDMLRKSDQTALMFKSDAFWNRYRRCSGMECPRNASIRDCFNTRILRPSYRQTIA